MFTNEKLNRRSCLKGLSLGVGGALFAPLLQKVAAAADGNVTPPKRFIFFTFTNGFQESAAIPMGWKRGADSIRQESLNDAELPRDIAPFAPFQDRMTIVQGLQGRHCARGHAGHHLTQWVVGFVRFVLNHCISSVGEVRDIPRCHDDHDAEGV